MMPDDLIEKAREDYKNEVLESLKSVASISPQNNENVDLLFARVPELATIGSKEDYLRYLSTIYPDSVADRHCNASSLLYYNAKSQICNFFLCCSDFCRKK